MSSANWLLDRRQFTGAVPKKIDQFSINLSDAQLSSISLYNLIVIPAWRLSSASSPGSDAAHEPGLDHLSLHRGGGCDRLPRDL